MPAPAFPSVSSASSGKKFQANDAKNPKKKKTGGFQSLGLSEPVYGGIMRLGYKVPTPIQRKTLPLSLAGKDVVAMARTGSGKTAAFLIPMLEKLSVHSAKSGCRGLILSPTRELAQQTHKFCESMAKFTGLRLCLIQGGDSMDAQFTALSNYPDILIATPGRLVHLLAEVRTFSLSRVEYLVFDEADRLFEMGFAQQLQQVITECPEQRQTMLFSATMPRQLVDFARAGLSNPELVRLDTETKVSENLKLAFFTVRTEEKAAALIHLVTEIIPADDLTIIFAATRHHVEYVVEILTSVGVTCSVAYGSMDMDARRTNLDNFRHQKSQVLVVTDVAARGIDIPLLNNVINFEFPAKAKLFVHRVGRAARQGRNGTAYSFVTQDEIPFMVDTHLYLGRPVKVIGDEGESGETPVYSLSQMTPDNVHVGRFPQSVLDRECERVRLFLNGNEELQQLKKTMENSHQLYSSTRPEASRRSVKRSKELPLAGIHPLLMQSTTKGENILNGHLNHLRNFRPKQTVFEVEHAKKGKAQSSSTLTEMMKQKRSTHQHVISDDVKTLNSNKDVDEPENDTDTQPTEEPDKQVAKDSKKRTKPSSEKLATVQETEQEPVRKRHLSKAERRRAKKARVTGTTIDEQQNVSGDAAGQQRSGNMKEAATSFKDPKYYITTMDQEDIEMEEHLAVNNEAGRSRLEDAVLDLNPDENKEMSGKVRTYHWDKRKNKYIKATYEEHKASRRIRGESGAIINVKARGETYRKWQEKTKKKIDNVGGAEDMADSVVPFLDFNADKTTNVRKIAQLNRHRMANDTVKEEIKDEHKIRKERKEKEKRKEKNARPKGASKGFGSKKPQKPKPTPGTPGRKKGEASKNPYSRSRVISKGGRGGSRGGGRGGGRGRGGGGRGRRR